MAPSPSEIQNLLEHAVYQQLFNTDNQNRIMGKNPENTMQITGVNHLLTQFLEEITSSLSNINVEKISPFIHIFEKRFGIDLSKTEQKIQHNFDEMLSLGPLDGQEIMIYYTILTKVLESVREYSYNIIGLEQIKATWKKTKNQSFSGEPKAALQKLAALNDPDVSILYNLSFIAHLAQVYQNKKLIPTTRRLVTLRVNRIIKSISNSVNPFLNTSHSN
jgi:hypothetical protein